VIATSTRARHSPGRLAQREHFTDLPLVIGCASPCDPNAPGDDP
jgi:hypothetical protein